MQEKASSYINNPEEQKAASNVKKENPKEIKHNKPENINGENDEAPQDKKDDSSIIILILLMLLSHEGADNKLLLALLYLLL